MNLRYLPSTETNSLYRNSSFPPEYSTYLVKNNSVFLQSSDMIKIADIMS